MSNTMLIGGHVSAAGGLTNAIANGEAIGAKCIQIFGSSPRQWNVRIPSKKDADAFKAELKNSRIEEVYLHAPYLVNLASPIAANRKKSVKALAEHLLITEMIGAVGLIFHTGSGKGQPKEKALEVAAAAMKETVKKVPGKALLLIENASGGGDKVGLDAREIGTMMKKAKLGRIKYCYDTAHAFEAGILNPTSPKAVRDHFDEWDEQCGLENLIAIHANDSKTKFGSNHDRHENIGKGYMGLAAFKMLATDTRLRSKPWLLEVPGYDDEGPDAKNIKKLIACFK